MRAQSIRVNRPCWLVRTTMLIIFMLFLSTLFIPSVDALTLQEVFPHLPQDKYKALTEGKAVFFDAKVEQHRQQYLPESIAKAANQDVNTWLAQSSTAEWLIGSIFLLRGYDLSEESTLKLINSFAQIDTISGITYYSETRKKITVLFDDVYRVHAPGSRTALPNLYFEELPQYTSFFMHVKDVNFGSTWYSLSMAQDRDIFIIDLENASPLSFFVVRAFDTQALMMHFVVVPVSEGLIVISLSAATPQKTAAAFVDVYSAIEKRIIAIQGWIRQRAEAAKETNLAQAVRGSP